MVQRWDGDHRAHHPKVAGPNPAPATNGKARNPKGFRAFIVRRRPAYMPPRIVRIKPVSNAGKDDSRRRPADVTPHT